MKKQALLFCSIMIIGSSPVAAGQSFFDELDKELPMACQFMSKDEQSCKAKLNKLLSNKEKHFGHCKKLADKLKQLESDGADDYAIEDAENNLDGCVMTVVMKEMPELRERAAKDDDDEAAIDNVLANMQINAQKYIKDVSLPLYKKADVNGHYTSEFMANMLNYHVEGMLPVMTLSSKDSIDSITAYYESKLKSFKKYSIQYGGVVFVKGSLGKGIKEHDPVDPDQMKKLAVTPHVSIYDFPGKNGSNIRRIDIAYNKK